MSKISKMIAFECVAKAIDQGDYNTANEILTIINRSINKDKKNNVFTEDIELISKKEERYFKIMLIKEQEN